MTLAEYCEARVILPSLCAEPGPWSNARAPWQVGIMEALDDPAIEEVAIQKSSQGGGSQIGCNWLAQSIELDPSTALLVQPTENDARDFLADKMLPMVSSTPKLRALVVASRRGQLGGSTGRMLVYPGGWLRIAYAESPASLSSKSARRIFLDEVDRYPASSGVEGDPTKLARARSRTFWNRKILYSSTPTIAGASAIERLYQGSDRRRYWVPCHACGLSQVMVWSQVRWPEGRPEEACYRCSGCDAAWTDHQRWASIALGTWIADAPGGRRAGFHVTSMLSPWTTFAELAMGFLEAKRGGPETLKPWINHELGETFHVGGEVLDPTTVEGRAENYQAEPLPEGVLALVVGGDVQGDRVELEVLGIGLERESWSIDYYRILGDPDGPQVWEDVEQILTRRWRHPSGVTLGIAGACIDSGGHHTQAVYRFCTPREPRRVWAIKGRQGPLPIWARLDPRRAQRQRGMGHPVHIVGVDSAKEQLWHALRRTDPGPRYCHFPSRYPPEYFEQLGSEERVVKFDNGRSHHVWQKINGRPNEAWDCRVYAIAALEALLLGGLDLKRLHDARASAPEQPVRRQPTPSITIEYGRRQIEEPEGGRPRKRPGGRIRLSAGRSARGGR